MNKRMRNKDKDIGNYDKEYDRWFGENIDSVLDVALIDCPAGSPENISDEFMASCDEAADRAYNLALLREKKSQIGFLPLTFAEYVLKLVEETELSPNLIPSLTGLQNLEEITIENIQAIVEFARQIQMTLLEILLLVRLGFVSSMGMGTSHLLFARQRGASPDMYAPDAIEEQLKVVERDYDPKDETELFIILEKIREKYEEE